MEGAVPSDTYISFAIGGAAYSKTPNPWAWLTSQEAAEAMAEEVATWRDLYNVDGIDLDIEAGAGDQEVRKRNTTQINYKCFSTFRKPGPICCISSEN